MSRPAGVSLGKSWPIVARPLTNGVWLVLAKIERDES